MPNVNQFLKVPAKIPYSSGFDKAHRNSLTGTTGTLVPIFCKEILPNSNVYLRVPCEVKLPPLASDTYMNVNYKMEAFFCPTRLLMKGYDLWLDGETTITKNNVESKLRTPVIRFNVPANTKGSDIFDIGRGSLMDYLGMMSDFVVSNSAYTLELCAFPVLAYHLIYEEWYRNSLIQKSLFGKEVFPQYYVPRFFREVMPSTDNYFLEPDAEFENGDKLLGLHQRNFQPDYYTIATTSPQNGPSVGVHLYIADDSVTSDRGIYVWGSEREKATFRTREGVNRNTESNTNTVGGFTIASLRAANSVQQFLERNRIAGNRFVDYLRANYGAELADGVAQRPVYLGSTSIPVFSSGVLQNSPSADNSASSNNPFDSVGSQYGKAVARDGNFTIKFHADEPGYLMVIGSLVPEVTYSSGIDRKFMRYVKPDSRSDMANPLLQNVGAQPIYQCELEQELDDTDFTNVFGFVDRYADWMVERNEVHGELRDGGSLQSFVLQRGLNTDGITSSFLTIPKNFLDQVLAVTLENSKFSYWADFYFDYKASQPLQKYSIPSLQDPAYEHGDTIWLNRGGVRIS